MKKFLDIFSYHNSNMTFIIGGSLGISKEVLDNCDYKLCFSPMTFPHQLMQVILLLSLDLHNCILASLAFGDKFGLY